MRESLLLQHCRSKGGLLSQLIAQRLMQNRNKICRLRLTNAGFADFLGLMETESEIDVSALELLSVDLHSGAELFWQHIHNVRSLYLHSGSSLEQLIQVLDVIDKSEEWALSALEEITITEVDLGGYRGRMSLGRLIKRVYRVGKVAVERCRMDYYQCEEMVDALGRLKTVQSLSLCGNPLEDSGLVSLSAAISTMHSLTDLNLSACHISKCGLTALLSHIPASVISLNLSSNALAGEAMQSFSDFAEKITGIQRLDISGNDMGPEGCLGLASFLRTVGGLIEFKANCNYIGPTGFSYILSSFSSRHLTLFGTATMLTLELSMNDIPGESLMYLAPHLQQLFEIRCLDLSTNHFGPGGAVALSRNVVFLPNLTVLNLSENGIRDMGASALGKCGKFFISLRELILSSNAIQKKGFISLISGLTAAACLEILKLDRNPISDGGVEKALCYLSKMEDLKEIDLRGTKITQKAMRGLDSLRRFKVLCG